MKCVSLRFLKVCMPCETNIAGPEVSEIGELVPPVTKVVAHVNCKLTCRLISFNDRALAASSVHIQLGVTDVTLPDPLIISVSLLHGRNIQIACNKCTAAVNLSINHSHNQAIYLPKEQ